MIGAAEHALAHREAGDPFAHRDDFPGEHRPWHGVAGARDAKHEASDHRADSREVCRAQAPVALGHRARVHLDQDFSRAGRGLRDFRDLKDFRAPNLGGFTAFMAECSFWEFFGQNAELCGPSDICRIAMQSGDDNAVCCTRDMHSRMDWRSIQFDWNRARAFLVAAEEGSFSAAGRALGMAQPTVGRQVAALEEELDVFLFDRSARQLQLTPTGLNLLELVRGMGESASRVSLAATGQAQSLRGTVCISVGQIEAVFVLPSIVASIREKHPGIELEILSTNETSDLTRREADIAIRNFRPTLSDLIARKVKDGVARLYASLASIGNPTTAQGLAQAQFIGFDRGATLIDGLTKLGLSLTPSNFPIISANQLVQWELTKRGVGISIMLDEIGDPEPRVQRALPSLPPFPVARWLVTHRELTTSRRMRVVFDLLLEGLSAAGFPGTSN